MPADQPVSCGVARLDALRRGLAGAAALARFRLVDVEGRRFARTAFGRAAACTFGTLASAWRNVFAPLRRAVRVIEVTAFCQTLPSVFRERRFIEESRCGAL